MGQCIVPVLNQILAQLLPRLQPNTAPPPDYYANNLLAVVSHVLRHHDDLLGAAKAYAQTVMQLSADGGRLLARLIMRTTACIRLDSLNYNEIVHLESALQELLDGALIQLNPAVAAEQLLQRIKVAELKMLFPESVGGTARKSDLVERILTTYTDTFIRTRCAAQVPWLTHDSQRHLKRVQLVYFGDLYRNLTEFVVRDLGISAFEHYALGASSRAFANDVEVSAYLDLTALQRLPSNRRSAALNWLLQQQTVRSRELENRSLLRRRDKLLNDWGRDFERTDQTTEAHLCYLQSTSHPARERRARLYAKEAATKECGLLLSQMCSEPWSMEEQLFAQRFTTQGRTRRQSSVVWQETEWTVPTPQLTDVELRTGQLLTRNGGRAWHTENSLLLTLLGLVFWDILFCPEPGMFTHPFQSGPRDLYWPDFRRRRQQAIAARLAQCADTNALWAQIADTVSSKFGLSCRLVSWNLVAHNNGEILDAVRTCFTSAQLVSLFDYMLNDLGQVRNGMPDLFVAYGGRRFELVEVKGPSDQLQPNQRVWLRQLCELGIPCRVVKHRYIARKSGANSGASRL